MIYVFNVKLLILKIKSTYVQNEVRGVVECEDVVAFVPM